MYQTVLFDLDGTLTDPGEGITNSVAHALRRWGIEPPEREKLYPFIGPPLSESFRKYYGFSQEDSETSVTYYREYFAVKGLFENEVYPGVETLLKKLKESGRRVVLATSKPEEYARKILEHFHLDGFFDLIAGASMDESRNKKGDVIAYALGLLGNPPANECVMVGDRKHDVQGARENGIPCIGVLYGYGNEQELKEAGAEQIAETVEDILKYV